MKHKIIQALAVTLVLSTAVIASAETGVNVSASAAVSVGAQSSSSRPTQPVKEAIKTAIQTRAENKYDKMVARFKATIAREEEIMQRLDARIAKIKANGGNTAEAETLSLQAKVHLNAAKASLISFTALAQAQFSLETASTTAKALREGLASLKKAGAEIEVHLREAHKSMLKIVGVLRGVSQLKNASSTASVNASTSVNASNN